MVGVVVAKIIDFPYENHDPHRAKSIEIGVGRNREFVVFPSEERDFPSEKRDFSSEKARHADGPPRRIACYPDAALRFARGRARGRGSVFVSRVTLFNTGFPSENRAAGYLNSVVNQSAIAPSTAGRTCNDGSFE
jgi:hypothetical protein